MRKFVLLGLLLSFSAQAAGTITVEAIGGPADGAFLEQHGKKTTLHKGDILAEGDLVETGTQTAVDIRLADDTIVRVGVNSSYLFEKDSQGLFQRLVGGIVRVLVPETKAKEGIRYRLATPAGTIGVRGTEFIVQYQKPVTSVYGLKGEVLFGPKNDFSDLSKFMVVTKDYASTMKQGASLPTHPSAFDAAKLLKNVNSHSFAPLASRQAGLVLARSEPSESADNSGQSPQFVQDASVSEVTQTTTETVVLQKAQVDPNEALITAASSGSVPGIKQALAAGAQALQAKIGTGDTALHIAAVNDRLEAVQYLIDGAKMPVDIENARGQTPLMRAAAEAGTQDIVLLLLQNGADLRRKDKGGATAIDYAKKNPIVKDMAAFLQRYISNNK